MNSIGAPLVELRLLSYRPAEMAAWWSALLGVQPHPVTAKLTTVTAARLGVVIERSQTAFDYHPEASGVTAINLTFDEPDDIRATVDRLAGHNSHPYRATRQGAVTALWFRDPNGTDVALSLPSGNAGPDVNLAEWPDELDPDTVLADTEPSR
ncbi:hypothetical protein MSAS_18800 [Mycobacterium saskatchewanense]|uniref:Glyoxalase/fosfomycin resistance/dioxygenase domain-containing protein n=1 Tax=Mycobacterium saskatchewanense TaxID=220927 RepID=A0AAJ3TWS8_9MYCO|nr:VOC family protein [Mycobacterium saskatchewanense]ORW71120.1 hypothetical protein AWC23_00980 [Mycobacterium saskatchewanense]BBX62706.1 hypothetical protein MSAS_18800 [Mycobacterium saskatchewanense]